jgi:hypothetical protein
LPSFWPEATEAKASRYVIGPKMEALRTRFLQGPTVTRTICRDMGPEDILVKVAYVSPNRQDG